MDWKEREREGGRREERNDRIKQKYKEGERERYVGTEEKGNIRGRERKGRSVTQVRVKHLIHSK